MRLLLNIGIKCTYHLLGENKAVLSDTLFFSTLASNDGQSDATSSQLNCINGSVISTT